MIAFVGTWLMFTDGGSCEKAQANIKVVIVPTTAYVDDNEIVFDVASSSC